MDNEQKDVKGDAQATSVEESSTSETTAQPTRDVSESGQPAEQTIEDDSKVGKRTAQARIRELAGQRKTAQSENERLKGEIETLSERIRNLTEETFDPSTYGGYPQQTDIQPGVEITQEQYVQDISQRAATAAYLVAQQQRAVDRIQRETNEIERDYPELNPQNKDVFDRDLSEAVATAVEAQVRVLSGHTSDGQQIYAINPNVSPKDIVKKLMKPYQKSVSSKVAEETTTVAAQIGKAAMRPTPTAPHTEKSAQDMSVEELENKLGIVY